jgi:hypothetical protein
VVKKTAIKNVSIVDPNQKMEKRGIGLLKRMIGVMHYRGNKMELNLDFEYMALKSLFLVWFVLNDPVTSYLVTYQNEEAWKAATSYKPEVK